MFYKGKKLTLDNYLGVVGKLPQDVLDEIRSAIMDGVDLSKWLDRSIDDPFILQQLRVSVKQGLPEWLLEIPYAQSLRNARKLYLNGINVDSLKKIIDKSLPERYFNAQIEMIFSGRVIPDWLDLTTVSGELLEFTQWGITRDYPLMGIVNQTGITKEYAMACLKLRIKGQNIDNLLSNNLNIGVLEALYPVADKPYYRHIVGLLDSTTPTESVETLIELGRKDFPFGDHDMSLYNSMQLSWIYEAFEAGMDYRKLLDPSYTQRDLVTIYQDLNVKDKSKTYRL